MKFGAWSFEIAYMGTSVVQKQEVWMMSDRPGLRSMLSYEVAIYLILLKFLWASIRYRIPMEVYNRF